MTTRAEWVEIPVEPWMRREAPAVAAAKLAYRPQKDSQVYGKAAADPLRSRMVQVLAEMAVLNWYGLEPDQAYQMYDPGWDFELYRKKVNIRGRDWLGPNGKPMKEYSIMAPSSAVTKADIYLLAVVDPVAGWCKLAGWCLRETLEAREPEQFYTGGVWTRAVPERILVPCRPHRPSL